MAHFESTLKARPYDIGVLFITRSVRLFAFGAISVILVLYLKEVGLSEKEIGLLLTMTLVGDTLISLLITTTADRLGRKRMLIAGAVLMVLGGAAFALTQCFLLLLVAATVGVISPSGNEVGPFLAIEQAALAQNITAEQTTKTFAWYHVAGSLATAAGCLVSGGLVQALESFGLVTGYRVILLGYAALGFSLAMLFSQLSAASEVPKKDHSSLGPPRQAFLGLHRSHGVIFRLSALFALDAFAGGFVLQSVMVFWFYVRFGADLATLGSIFFAANALAGFSGLAAAALARRFGLINTMVFTHIPSNVLLILVPFMPTLPLAVTVLLLRFTISQMDVPARQAYTAIVVSPEERSGAAGVTNVARTTGASLSPVLAGLLLGSGSIAGTPFVLAGALKLLYDGLLFRSFRKANLPKESGS
jgi:MFS family permease